MTTRLFNSAGVSNESSRTPHELTIGGGGGGKGYDGHRDDAVSEFSLRVTSIPPGEQEKGACLDDTGRPAAVWTWVGLTWFWWSTF